MTGGSEYGTCCLNGAFYACGDKASFDQCAGFDVGACLAACAPDDFPCHDACFQKGDSSTHDPSACTRTASRDGECKSGGGGGGGGICPIATQACTYSSDCGVGKHCNGGKCYDDQAGCPCTYSSDCGVGAHCTGGTCLSDSAGSACTYSSDCGVGSHCTDGKCWRDESGSPCTYSSDCGVGSSCVDGRCS